MKETEKERLEQYASYVEYMLQKQELEDELRRLERYKVFLK